MAVFFPDIIRHNNPILALADSDFVRGGRRVVPTLAGLYALAPHFDQLKEWATLVYVESEDAEYQLVDISNAHNLLGWRLYKGGELLFGDSSSIQFTKEGNNISATVDVTYIRSLFSAGYGLQYDQSTGTFILNYIPADTGSTILQAGSGILISGDGTETTPFVISSVQTQSDWNETNISSPAYIKNKPLYNGSETKLQGGSNVTVTGMGTVASPYVIAATDTNFYPTSLEFDPNTGILLIARNGLPALTEDLNGRWLTSYTETDPVFTASPAASVTNTLIGNWNTAYDNTVVDVSVTGAEVKTLTLLKRDGSTLTATFSDLTETVGGEPVDTNDYPTSLSFEAGVLTLGILNRGNLTAFVPLSKLADVNLSSPTEGQLLRYSGGKWGNWTPNFLTSYTESDPVALKKTVTLLQGNGLVVAGAGSRTLETNPSWTLSVDTPYIRSLFSAGSGIGYDPTTGKISLNYSMDGSETKLIQGEYIKITGTGTTLNPYRISADFGNQTPFSVRTLAFRTGVGNGPAVDSTSFVLKGKDNLPILNKDIELFREDGQYNWATARLGFTYDPATGIIRVTESFFPQELIVVKIYPFGVLNREAVSGDTPTENTGFPYKLPLKFV